jgi:carboxypeptidase C (cathepsin A)
MFAKKILLGTVTCLLLVSTVMTQSAAAQDKRDDNPKKDERISSSSANFETPTVVDSTTEGKVTVGGRAITYKAVAGTLMVGSTNMQDAELGATVVNGGKTEEHALARMFYVAYFKKDASAERPVTFIYNGGPGGASMPLHMGAFGPRRVVLPNAQPDSGAPYRVINNEYSLLDVSDVVFIDPPGTGYGRITGPEKEKAFWGNDADTHAFERFIQRFLTKYDRWNSPKYLLGESYGTLRNAMLAANLQNVHLNGIVMLSQILDFNNYADGQKFSPGVDQSYALALPTFAATAFYHRKLPSQPIELEPFLAEVEQFALGDYMRALLQGSELTDAGKQSVAERLHGYTGLPVAYLLKANLRVSATMFMQNLLLDDEMTTGQLDARYQGPDLDPMSEAAQYDPLINAIVSPFVSALNGYMRTELKYGNDQTYKVFASSDENFTWDWRHKAPGGPPAGQEPVGTNVMPDLAFAMKSNPKMKVMLAGGYYDLTTPFFEGMFEMHHLQIPQKLQANISYHYYQSGHMVYLNEGALRQFHDDVARFIDETDTGR